jgi:hypothetical protein
MAILSGLGLGVRIVAGQMHSVSALRTFVGGGHSPLIPLVGVSSMLGDGQTVGWLNYTRLAMAVRSTFATPAWRNSGRRQVPWRPEIRTEAATVEDDLGNFQIAHGAVLSTRNADNQPTKLARARRLPHA